MTSHNFYYVLYCTCARCVMCSSVLRSSAGNNASLTLNILPVRIICAGHSLHCVDSNFQAFDFPFPLAGKGESTVVQYYLYNLYIKDRLDKYEAIN